MKYLHETIVNIRVTILYIETELLKMLMTYKKRHTGNKIYRVQLNNKQLIDTKQ